MPEKELNVPAMTEADLEALLAEGYHSAKLVHVDWVAGAGFRINCPRCAHVEWARRHGAVLTHRRTKPEVS